MGLFDRIFGKKNNPPQPGEHVDLTPEQFFNTDYVKQLIERYKRPATLLRPHKSSTPVGQMQSKFGGMPNWSGFNQYPCCDTCQTPLNFVLQLYRKDFPDFYFPGDEDLFQLFRCPNNDCPGAWSEYADHKMFHYYFHSGNEAKILAKPPADLPDMEPEIPDCYLKPLVVEDFPNYDDFEGNEFVNIETKFGKEHSDSFMDKYSAIPNSKFGGYPAFTQGAYRPKCTCEKEKEFFFQLTSEDREDGTDYPPAPDKWSAHGIMIGDVGGIYYFVCKSCGPQTIESGWDCY